MTGAMLRAVAAALVVLLAASPATKHDWELYDGDHGNRVSERLEKVVFPFFAKHLVFPKG